MTSNRSATWLMFVWLTLGYAVVHIVITAWGFSVLQSFFSGNDQSEHLQVFEDDGPLIQNYNRGSQKVAYRRLDGTVVTGPIGMHAGGAALTKTNTETPNSWKARLAAFNDFQSPTVNWYLVAPPDHPGTAYFVGYEQLSRRLAGFIGTQGFSTLQPPSEQFFRIQTSAHNAFYGAVTATQSAYQNAIEPSGVYYQRQTIEVNNAALDAVWILSAGTLYEIRLGTRKVRVLMENHPEFQTLVSTRFKRDGKSYLQLLTRTDQGVVVIDPETLQEQSIALEPPSPGSNEIYYQLANGQRMIITKTISLEPGTPSTSQIRWLDADGNEERSEDVTLASSPAIELISTIGVGLAFPAPVILLASMSIAPLMEPRHTGERKSYSSRATYYATIFAPWIVTSVIVGILTGWTCRRRELAVFANESWLWPVVVGLCGWFGWIGYSFVRPLPARLPNGAWLPAQPEPNRPLGTEIFA